MLELGSPRRTLKNKERELSLSIEENIFILLYDASNKINLYRNEPRSSRKKIIHNEIFSLFKKIKIYVTRWSVGNITYIKNSIGSNIIELKNNISKIDETKIKVNEEILYQFQYTLNTFLNFLCNHTEGHLQILNTSIEMLPQVSEDTQIAYGIIDSMYIQPVGYSFMLSLIITSLIFMLSMYINYKDKLMLIITVFLGSFAIIFQVLNSKKDSIRIKKIDEKSYDIVAKDKIEIIKDDEKYLLLEHFEYDTSNLNKYWKIDIKNQGNVSVTREIKGALGSNSCLKIESSIGSNAVVRKEFNASKCVHITYYLFQKYIHPNNAGSPFIVQSPIGVGNPKDNRVVYMDIFRGNLRHSLKFNPVCQIHSGEWYKIELIINCVDHWYEIYINNNKIDTGQIHSDFTSVNAIRTKHFGSNEAWITYIDEIKIIEIE